MSATDTKTSSSLRTAALVAVVVLLLLVVVVFLRRREYPDGTLVSQQRTYVAEQLNPDLGDVLAAVVPGQTTTAELTERLGEPSAKVENEGLELWVYTMRVRKVTDRMLLGLVRTGGSSESVESQMPIGVKDGVVVHTYLTPSADPALKAAVESMWDEFTPGA